MDTEQVRVLAALGAVRCQGWVGRRDRVLLVLSGLAGLSYRDIAVLTVGDVVVTGGAATVPGPVGPITLAATQDARVCSPCVLARWLHLLDLAVIHSDGCVVTAMIARTAALVADTPHVCRGAHPLTALHPRSPLLPVVDRWGVVGATGEHAPAGLGIDERARRLERRARHLLPMVPAP